MRKPERSTLTIPLVHARTLWHLGTLNPEEKYRQGHSYEGNLLSVSACPKAWQQIARLGGQPCHQSTQEVLLVNVWAALDKPKFADLREHVTDYGLEQGYLAKATVVEVRYFDDDLDAECSRIFASREEAIYETDELDEEYGAQIDEIEMLVATDTLKQIHNLHGDIVDGLQYALIEWVREHAPTLSENLGHPVAGVYWKETFDPYGLSAPRGGVFTPDSLALTASDHIPEGESALDEVMKRPPLKIELDSLNRPSSDLAPA